MLSAEGLITLERVTLDGTKIKANASGNTFRRKEKLEAHLALAQEQVQKMNAQAAEEDKRANRQIAAQRRAARQRKSRLESALREVERLQRTRKHDRDEFVARASSTDPQAHVMRNGEGGTVPISAKIRKSRFIAAAYVSGCVHPEQLQSRSNGSVPSVGPQGAK